jgi:sialidase-1
MIRSLNYILFLSFTYLSQVVAQQPTVVFTSGKEGYKIFRIPAVIRFKKEILAFAEGRVNGGADFGHIDIVLKKSSDDGKTWSALCVVASNDSLQAGNPAPVVDLADPQYPKGRIFLFYNTGNQSESNNRKGKGIREVWYKTSVDAGRTWSEPVNITTYVHRPNQPKFNAAYQFTEDWRSYANTPGHAIQIAEGKYKGRLYVAANHSAGEPQKDFSDYSSHGFYTDDHGKTFHLSNTVAIAGSNEAMAVALPGDQLMMNIRNQKGDIKRRIIALSKDGVLLGIPAISINNCLTLFVRVVFC